VSKRQEFPFLGQTIPLRKKTKQKTELTWRTQQ